MRALTLTVLFTFVFGMIPGQSVGGRKGQCKNGRKEGQVVSRALGYDVCLVSSFDNVFSELM